MTTISPSDQDMHIWAVSVFRLLTAHFVLSTPKSTYERNDYFVAKKSRIDAWSLMKILVVPCLFLCAIFKHPAFQWIATGALALWVCFMLAEIIPPSHS